MTTVTATPVGVAQGQQRVFLTRKRLRYALIAGGSLWIAWFISIALGPGNFDLAGQAVGNDFSQFYAAGITVREGNSELLYDIEYQYELEKDILGPPFAGFHAFLTPPFHAWIYVPFTYLPYELAVAAWSVVGLIGLWFALRMARLDPRRVMPWALTFFPVFAAISFGQQTLLSMVILAGTYALWRNRRLVLAGLTLSLILYKPQLALGLLVLWGLEWRRDWRALAGFAAGGASLAAFCFLAMPEASRAYIGFSRDVLPELMTFSNPSVWHMHTLRSFFELLLGLGPLATGLAVGTGLAATAAFIVFWRAYRDRPSMLFAGAMVLTFLITPHALVYEWAILVLPAGILWFELPGDRRMLARIYAPVWLTIWLAAPITRMELIFTGRAFQMSVPVLVAGVIVVWRRLMNDRSVDRIPQASSA